MPPQRPSVKLAPEADAVLYSWRLEDLVEGQAFMKHRFAVVLTLVILLSSLASGLLGGNEAVKAGTTGQTSPNEFLTNFTEALDVIQQTYAVKVGPDKLVYSAIKGMLRSLDPHSSFFDPKEFFRLREEQHSKYFGLGIRVRPLLRDHGRHVIVEPPAIGSPAEKKGLRAGDVIVRIEGEPIDEWTSDEVVNHLRGPRGTTVNISVERQGVRDLLELNVERDEIPLITVPYAFEIRLGIGYVRIDRFSESTSKELRDKLKELNSSNLSGLILDLRDNPGGLLNQAIEVADCFLPSQSVVVVTKGRAEGSERKYKAPSSNKVRIPLVVLINRHSASASEIVAGALQDHDRALIVGETSFGKGLVQSVYPLENDTGMALTTAKYYTPSGRLIQRDYSGSTFEYYYMNAPDEGASSNSQRDIRYTDKGRKVYSGGGITPDVVEPMRELNRFEATLNSKDVFFQFARLITSGQVGNFHLPVKSDKIGSAPNGASKSLPGFEITDAIFASFKQFLHERSISYSDEEIQSNIDFIKRRIKQEVFNSSFGLQEGIKVGIQGDSQVLKALDMMPDAKLLMTSGITMPTAQNPIR